MNCKFRVAVHGKGLYEITQKVAEAVSKSNTRDGLATIFIQHTSASLIIQENADPAVLIDLDAFLNRLAPEDDEYTHKEEGIDDMPAHLKSALTSTSISVPVIDGELALGTWQGIFLWEHRYSRKQRNIIVHVA